MNKLLKGFAPSDGPKQLFERLHVREVGELIPESVPVLLLSTLLMLSLPFGLAQVDKASKAALISRRVSTDRVKTD